MALTITVTAHGIDDVQRMLDRYQGPHLERSLGKASYEAAGILVGPMRAAAPVRSGALQRSVKVTRATRRDKPGALVGPRIWYRHFVIGGTRRGVRPNPFPTRVAAAYATATSRRFREVLHDELKR